MKVYFDMEFTGLHQNTTPELEKEIEIKTEQAEKNISLIKDTLKKEQNK